MLKTRRFRRVVLVLVVGMLIAGSGLVAASASAPHHRTTKPKPGSRQLTPTNAQVTYHAAVLDDAGAHCPVPGVDLQHCPVPLVPVHAPIGEATTQRTVPVSSGNGARLVSDISWNAGWRHVPCYCTSGKVLLDVHESWFQVNFAEVAAGVRTPGKTSSYVQQLYGFFAAGYDWETVYNYASYAPQDQAYRCCDSFAQNVRFATYYDGRIILYFNCSDPYELAYGRGYLDFDGSGFWGGWVTLDETGGNCAPIYKSHGTNTHMA